MTLKQFSDQMYELKKKEHPNMPAHAIPRPKYTDKTANGLQNAILHYLTHIKKIKAWRQASEGRFLREQTQTNVIGQKVVIQKARYIPRGKAGGKGAGDISAVVKGRFISLEVKIGKDRQSDAQKEFQQELEFSGGIYIIVKTWDDFIEKIQLHLK